MLSFSEMRKTSLAVGESVSKIFILHHRHTGGIFEGINTTTAPEVLLAMKSLKAEKAASYDEIRPKIFRALI